MKQWPVSIRCFSIFFTRILYIQHSQRNMDMFFLSRILELPKKQKNCNNLNIIATIDLKLGHEVLNDNWNLIDWSKFCFEQFLTEYE